MTSNAAFLSVVQNNLGDAEEYLELAAKVRTKLEDSGTAPDFVKVLSTAEGIISMQADLLRRLAVAVADMSDGLENNNE